ncbi:hypothetical protein SAE02_77360 [Skermanella aerolata]|uniref:Uncharacterized protein n=1 Tax=Skermanella aerolata TaxID=393310 RepID=A0A512E4F3_9PROT|nr:hypothetical protein SAE02_77360 [Skermanella aerolata]
MPRMLTEPVGDHHAGCPAFPLQQLAQQALGRLLVVPALDQDIKHDAVLIHSALQIMLLAGNLEDDFIHVPLVAGARQPSADDVGELLAELQPPLPDHLVADLDASEREHLLHHA